MAAHAIPEKAELLKKLKQGGFDVPDFIYVPPQHFETEDFATLESFLAKHRESFKVIARIEAASLNDIGLAYDFVDLKAQLAEVISRFDHANLNEVPPFDKLNPSSENLAANIFEGLKDKLAGDEVKLVEIEVWESPENMVSFREG